MPMGRHKNKYRDHAIESRRQRWIERSCLNKRRYDSEGDAFQANTKVYACGNCGGWHRSGSIAELAANLRKRRP